MTPPVRLLLVTPNADNNSLGRTHCLWLLARHLGWAARVVAVKGAALWEPLRDDPFAEDCLVLTDAAPDRRHQQLVEAATWSDVVVAVKPLPTSLGVAAPLARQVGRPLLLDVDDPDIEVRTTGLPLRRLVKDRLLSGRYRELVRLRELARSTPVLVSNPTLQASYGGVLVPHVRPLAPRPRTTAGRDIVVRFVGSPRGHKGLDVLRDAVARFGGDGVRLEVTAPPPDDAHAWEGWLGQTTFAAGQQLAASADVVALPSLVGGWSGAQLPAKLVDAMIFGRPVVASDLPPLRWAVGDTGLLVPPGDPGALAQALAALRDPVRREALGSAAHARAAEMFSVPAVAPAFGAYVRSHITTRPLPAGTSASGPPGARA